jgi:hypothetical protein
MASVAEGASLCRRFESCGIAMVYKLFVLGCKIKQLFPNDEIIVSFFLQLQAKKV